MIQGTLLKNCDVAMSLTSAIDVSSVLAERISEWLERYENAHFFQFENAVENELLDKQGIEIARSLKVEFPDAQVTYFSNAYVFDFLYCRRREPGMRAR